MGRPVRVHIAVGVSSIDTSREFYERYFAAPPTRVAHDQVDWILDDPAINFSIFYNPDRPIGVEHFGLDVDGAELPNYAQRMAFADSHVTDPDGVRVELFNSD